jgi:hypothetical protein
MTLLGRDRESTRGTHGILTVVDWCFGKEGLAEQLSSTGERRKLTPRGRRWATKCGGLASSRLRWRLNGVSFIGRRRGDGAGARTEKDVRRARHTLVDVA